jgi:DNA-binding NarL/FixJ family response regulator
MSSNIRLLVVDDHAVVRVSLVAWLETAAPVTVVGQAGTVAEAIAEARRCQPDVVLLDVRLPDGSGVEACRQIRAERPATQVVMLTSYGDEEAVVASVLAGAAGYLLKESDPPRLIEAIEAAAAGQLTLGRSSTEVVRAWMLRMSTGRPTDPLDRLNEQERLILERIAEGKTNAEIAAALNLSPSTVKGYVSTILQKLQLHRRAEAAAYISRHKSPYPGG